MVGRIVSEQECVGHEFLELKAPTNRTKKSVNVWLAFFCVSIGLDALEEPGRTLPKSEQVRAYF